MKAIQLLICSALLFSAFGCAEDDLCAQAAEKFTQCTGKAATPLPYCDVVMAEYYVAQPCWALEGAKGDTGELCDSLFLCTETRISFPTQPLTLEENAIQPVSGAEKLKVWVGEVGPGDRVPIIVFNDKDDVLKKDPKNENAKLGANLDTFSYFSDKLESFALALLGVKDGKTTFPTSGVAIKVDAISAPIQGPTAMPEKAATLPRQVSLTLSTAPLEDYTIGTPSETKYEKINEFTLYQGSGVGINLASSAYFLTVVSVEYPNKAVVSAVPCDENRFCTEAASKPQQLKTIELGGAQRAQQPWTAAERELANVKVAVQPTTPCNAANPCVEMILLGEKKPEKATAQPTPTAAGLKLELADKPQITLATGEVRWNGKLCYEGTGTSEASTIVLEFRKAGETTVLRESTVDRPAQPPGCQDWSESLAKIMDPGSYTVTAYLRAHKEAALSPKPFDVPERSGVNPYTADLAATWDTNLVKNTATRQMTIKLIRVINNGVNSADASKILIEHVIKSGGAAVASRTLDVRALNAGESQQFTDVVFDNVQPGTYTLRMTVDSAGSVPEGDKESNNVMTLDYTMEGTGSTGTQTQGVNLKVEGLSQGATTTNGVAPLVMKICNRGNTESPAFQVGIYSGRTTQPSCGEATPMTVQFNALTAGGCADRIQPVTAAGGTTLGVFVDPNCAINEGNLEGDNFQTILLGSTVLQGTPTPGGGGTQRDPNAGKYNLPQSSDGCSIGGSPSLSPLLLLLGLLLRSRRRRSNTPGRPASEAPIERS